MFELFFVFTLKDSYESWQFQEKYKTIQSCEKAGEKFAEEFQDHIKQKYPHLKEFEIFCSSDTQLTHV